eukprot:scaffold4229_cov30-Tisochrysis_lutea.AAC.10
MCKPSSDSEVWTRMGMQHACADGARSPRCRTGTMSESDGGSTQCSNWQCASAESAASVAEAGSFSASSSAGTISAISGLRITEPTDSSAAAAASRTYIAEDHGHNRCRIGRCPAFTSFCGAHRWRVSLLRRRS